MSAPGKRLLCLDFDGVLHRYDSGWCGATVIPDGPVDGAIDFLTAAVERFKVCIFSSRSGQEGGPGAMRAWLQGHGLGALALARIEFPTEKPAAFVTLDDRAITFEGQWPDLDLLERFVPWNKRGYPEGKSSPDDQGELSIKVYSSLGLVRIDFGKNLSWIGLGPQGARDLVALLLLHARNAEPIT